MPNLFLRETTVALVLVALAEFAWVAVSFWQPRKPPSPQGQRSKIIDAGPVEDFTLGSLTAFPQGRFYLARLKDGGFLALSRQCTHLGCTVPWLEKEQAFVCPCHASSFDMTGNVVNPPAPRALDLYPIVIENQAVRVNTARRLKRSAFQVSQVTYPNRI